MLVIDHQLKQDRLAVWERIRHLKFDYNKVNRCLARYSPRATTTNRPTTGH